MLPHRGERPRLVLEPQEADVEAVGVVDDAGLHEQAHQDPADLALYVWVS